MYGYLGSYLVWGCDSCPGSFWNFHTSGCINYTGRGWTRISICNYPLLLIGWIHLLRLGWLTYYRIGLHPQYPSLPLSGIDAGDQQEKFMGLAWGYTPLLEHRVPPTQVNVSCHSYLLVSWYHIWVIRFSSLLWWFTTHLEIPVFHTGTK